MHKNAIKLLSYCLLILVIFGMFYHYRDDIYAVFSRVKWSYIGILSLLHIPMIALGGLSFKFLCSHYEINLKWRDWAGLSFIANFLNQLLPYRLGMGFRYLYMRQHFHMANSQFVYVMLIYFVFTIVICAIFALLGWLFSNLPATFNHLFYVTCLLGFFFTGFIIWLKRSRFNATQIMGKALTALQELIADPKIFFFSFIALTLVNILMAALFYLCLLAINAPLPISHCLFLVGVLTIAMLFPLTPGNIGILEALFGTLTQVIYHDFSMGFAAIALYRVSQWIPSIILGSTFSFLLAGSIIPSISGEYKSKMGRVN
ncbi:MAG: YbhN family protein [Candidatus Berkiella sp.]